MGHGIIHPHCSKQDIVDWLNYTRGVTVEATLYMTVKLRRGTQPLWAVREKIEKACRGAHRRQIISVRSRSIGIPDNPDDE